MIVGGTEKAKHIGGIAQAVDVAAAEGPFEQFGRDVSVRPGDVRAAIVAEVNAG